MVWLSLQSLMVMAFLPLHFGPPFLCDSSQPSFSLQTRTIFPHSFKTLRLKPCCSKDTIQPDCKHHHNLGLEVRKKNRKPRPSFYEQIREKWSLKLTPQTKKLPWQLEEEQPPLVKAVEIEELEEKGKRISRVYVPELKIDVARFLDANKSGETEFDSEPNVNKTCQEQKKLAAVEAEEVHDGSHEISASQVQMDGKQSISEVASNPERSSLYNSLVLPRKIDGSSTIKPQLDYGTKGCQDCHGRNETGVEFRQDMTSNAKILAVENSLCLEDKVTHSEEAEEKIEIGKTSSGFSADKETQKSFSSEQEDVNGKHGGHSKEKFHNAYRQNAIIEASGQANGANRLPWIPEAGLANGKEERCKRNNAELAEKILPEHELTRLRNIALRMKERIKVGPESVTQALVGSIHEKWTIDEVVKLKFEGPPAFNMKRTHEILERRTGGLVIWRSGSSIVLFRGMNYKFDFVQSYTRQSGANSDNVQQLQTATIPNSLRLPKGLSEEELMDMSELNDLLDTLGPRFLDWSGREPLPIDADLLPGVVPGYKAPFRLLPYGVRHGLRNKEMTFFRRFARTLPPHFALGRTRELEGLAAVMVKLWEKSAIAKIAIKRGVLNTCNERMAEELKKLTGGTLLSRNKEYIVFYRGNDFLPPAVTEALKEREKLTGLQHLEEEAQRDASALINSTAKVSKSPMVAGTLAETVAAISRWGNQPTGDDLEKMMKDSAVAKHASLVRYLEKKLALAKGKLTKAETALAKVQKFLEPAELPSDSETITDEERFLFRKIGLSMKPYLLLGRRGVFDGTIQNIHLHWKFRELVKIIVKGKSFAQLKHIAISLEAESGGVLVSMDKTTKGYAIVIYRGKNYQRPFTYRPRNLLTRRQALARSIELQRREALKHHVSDLQERIELLRSGLEDIKNAKQIDEKTLYERLDFDSSGDDFDSESMEEDDDEGEAAYLEVYHSSDENTSDTELWKSKQWF